MGTGSFPGVKSGQGVTLTPQPLLVPWSRKSIAILLLPLWAIWPVQSPSACTRVHFTFTFTFPFNLYRLCHVQAYIQFCLILLTRKLVGIVHVIQWVHSFELPILVKYWRMLYQLQVLFDIELCVMSMMGFVCKLVVTLNLGTVS